MNRILKQVITIVLLTLTVLFAASCNTIEGAGRDIERGGEEIQDVAD